MQFDDFVTDGDAALAAAGGDGLGTQRNRNNGEPEQDSQAQDVQNGAVPVNVVRSMRRRRGSA